MQALELDTHAMVRMGRPIERLPEFDLAIIGQLGFLRTHAVLYVRLLAPKTATLEQKTRRLARQQALLHGGIA